MDVVKRKTLKYLELCAKQRTCFEVGGAVVEFQDRQGWKAVAMPTRESEWLVLEQVWDEDLVNGGSVAYEASYAPSRFSLHRTGDEGAVMTLRFRVDQTAGGGVVARPVQVSIRAGESRHVDSKTMAAPLHDLGQEALSKLVRYPSSGPRGHFMGPDDDPFDLRIVEAPVVAEADARAVTRARRGRPPIPRAEVELAAQAYLEEVAKPPAAGVRRRPVDAVAGAGGWGRRQADARIKEARRLGLLPPTTKGKMSDPGALADQLVPGRRSTTKGGQ